MGYFFTASRSIQWRPIIFKCVCVWCIEFPSLFILEMFLSHERHGQAFHNMISKKIMPEWERGLGLVWKRERIIICSDGSLTDQKSLVSWWSALLHCWHVSFALNVKCHARDSTSLSWPTYLVFLTSLSVILLHWVGEVQQNSILQQNT